MSRTVPVCGALLWLLGACSDGGGLTALDGGDAPPDASVPQGLYDSPDDFDRTGCVPGSLAGIDPQGIYHLQIRFEGFQSTTAARFDVRGGGQFSGVLSGADATNALATADDLFLYRSTDGASVRALVLCARDAGGLLSGQYAFCNVQGCTLGTVTGKKVERLPEAEGSGLALLGEYASPTWGAGLSVNVRVVGNFAYLARYQDGLRILDVRNPSAIVEVGHAAVESADGNEIYNDVKITTAGGRTYAIMASNRAGAVVWDVSNPAAPRLAAHMGTVVPNRPLNVHTLFVDGGRAYLANTGLGLEIYDLANPEAPVRLGQFADPAGDDVFLHDLSVAGDRAYLNFWGAGMLIVDVSNPALPRRVGTFADYGEDSSHSNWVTTVGARRVAAHGDEQWGSHLRLVDVTEGTPGFTRPLGDWETRPEVSIHNLMAFGTTVFAAHYQDGIRVIDIADPAAPRQVAWWNTWPGHDPRYGYGFFEGAVGLDVDLARRRVYVADSHRGLLILADTRP